MNKFYRKVVVVQVLVDYLSVVVAFVLGYCFWKLVRPEIPFQLLIYLKLALFYGLVYILIFWAVKLYEENLSVLNVEQLRRIIKGWIVGGGVLLSAGFLSKELSFSRFTFIFAIVFLFFILVFQRGFLFRRYQSLAFKMGYTHKAVIIGVDEVSVSLFSIIKNSPWLGIVPVGFVDDEKTEVLGRDNKIYPVLGKLSQLKEVINSNGINQIILSYYRLAKEQVARVLKACAECDVNVKIIPHFYNVSVQKIEMENLLSVPLLSIRKIKVKSLYLFIKRSLDIVISLLILVLLSPLMLIIAFLIKKNSAGPILFFQERVGLNGRPFKIYKFRSMYVNANKYETCPNTLDDPRITKIGKFLRRSSFDELPQFINVLKGDMSLVGPRPEMPFIVEKYNDLQRERLRVKPGITGLWQISHQRGSPIHENIDYDLYYIENQSLTLDLAVILGTLTSIVKGIGAY